MGLSKQQIKQFEDYVAEIMKEKEIPGLAVAMTKDGEIAYKKGFGVRNEAGDPVTADTIFGIASISKSFAGLCVAQLVEEGKLTVDDAVTKFYPSYKLPGRGPDEVTVYHLLTHTTGLPPIPALGHSIRLNSVMDDDLSEEDRAKLKDLPIIPVNTYEQVIDFIAQGDYELLGKPGEFVSYSNDSYAVLSGVVEKASGRPFDQYVEDHIFKPLNMTRSTFSLATLKMAGNYTDLYYKKDDEIRCSKNWQEAPPYPGCGWVRSTASDMINYVKMYAQGGIFGDQRVLSPSGLASMTKFQNQYMSNRYYGYGLYMQPNYEGVTLIQHGGSLKGVASNAGFVPEKGIGVVVLCNLSGAPAAKIWLAAINLMLGLPLDNPLNKYEFTEWTKETMERFVGDYKSKEGWETTILQVKLTDDDQLVLTIKDETYPIKPISSDTGVVEDGEESEVRFYFTEGEDKAMGIGRGLRIVQRLEG